MQKTKLPGVALWSVWQPDRNLFFNTHFIERAEGNLLVDPLPIADTDAQEILARGGVAWIVVTNRDHVRDAAACARRFDAKVAAAAGEAEGIAVDRVLADGDVLCGATVIALAGVKTPGEFALHFRDLDTILVGDALWGDPAGSLRLMPDTKLADPPTAVLSLRKLRARRPRHLLVGDGASIFDTAFETLSACLEARTEVYTQRVNVDELLFVHGTQTLDFGVSRDVSPYVGGWAEIGWLLGAEKLGYAASRLEPGQALCPLHWHTSEEELCVVLAGTPTVRSPSGEFQLRVGDLVAFPARPSGSHSLFNASDAPCTLLLVARTEPSDTTFYPDSHKLMVEATQTMVRARPTLDYFDGELGRPIP